MAGSHAAPPRKSSRWKIWVLVAILLIVIAALGAMVYLALTGTVDLQGLVGSDTKAEIPDGVFTQVAVQDDRDRNVSGQITVLEGLMRPDTVDPNEELVLLDISWDSGKQANYPLKITVSDPSFPDGDGLAVHHYNEDGGAWELIGTYLIENHSVTFPASSLSPFAFQVISSEADAAPEATPEPTSTPEPTATPEPTPIGVVDYGTYTTAQNALFAQENDLDDDDVYVLALVAGLPQNEPEGSDSDDDGDEEAGDEVAIGFVETEGEDTSDGEAATVSANAITATVLLNKDGATLGTVEMGVSQTEDGVYYLTGPVTEGMLWTANADYYNGGTRYSLANNGRYLNTDDSGEHIVLDDNNVRTRWLYDSETLDDGSKIDVLTYRDNSTRYYISNMGLTQVQLTGTVPTNESEELSEAEDAAEGEDAPEETPAPAPATFSYDDLELTLTDDNSQSLRFVLFRLDKDADVPDDVITTSPDNALCVPAIGEDTDLNALEITVGGEALTIGTDYNISSQQIGGTVVVTITFTGDYTGQVIRTYSVYVEPEPTPTPEPTATPAPTAPPTTNNNGNGGGYTETQSPPAPTAPPATEPPAPTAPPAVDPASGSDTQVSTGSGSDTDT